VIDLKLYKISDIIIVMIFTFVIHRPSIAPPSGQAGNVPEMLFALNKWSETSHVNRYYDYDDIQTPNEPAWHSATTWPSRNMWQKLAMPLLIDLKLYKILDIIIVMIFTCVIHMPSIAPPSGQAGNVPKMFNALTDLSEI